MLWRPTDSVPERLGSALITNVSIGGVQLRTKMEFDSNQELLLQLGSEEGPLFIPGEVCYMSCAAEGLQTVGFNFIPKTHRDREAIARYMMTLQQRVCAS